MRLEVCNAFRVGAVLAQQPLQTGPRSAARATARKGAIVVYEPTCAEAAMLLPNELDRGSRLVVLVLIALEAR